MNTAVSFQGYLRQDGRKGIRNVIVVAYLVECAHHVSRRIVTLANDMDVHLIGFPGCFPNEYAFRMMNAVCTHPNVGGALLVSLGCESMNREKLLTLIRASGRPAELLVIQETGGTRATIDAGVAAVTRLRAQAAQVKRVPMALNELIVGTICGGSDGTSGITANPAVGRCFDALVAADAACIFEETGELIGCEAVMADRAITPELGAAIEACVEKRSEEHTSALPISRPSARRACSPLRRPRA